MFRYLHYNEDEIKSMIQHEMKCPGAPIKKSVPQAKKRKLSSGSARKLKF